MAKKLLAQVDGKGRALKFLYEAQTVAEYEGVEVYYDWTFMLIMVF